MMTRHVLARVLIAGSLTALIGAASAQDVPPAPRSVRVVYPGPFGNDAPPPVRTSPATAQPPADAGTEQSAPASSLVMQPPMAAVLPSSPAQSSRAEQIEAPTASTAAEHGNLLDINSASVDELNGLGGRYGKAIVAGRPYQSIDELVSRRILTRAVFGQIKDQITAR